MKRTSLLFIVSVLTTVLSGCGETQHIHTYDTNKWTTNANQHWHAATCGHKLAIDVANHSDSDKDGKCDVCDYVLGDIPGHVHTFSSDWSNNSTEHWHAATCGHDVVDSKGNHIDSDKNNFCDVCGYKMGDSPLVPTITEIAVAGLLSKTSYLYTDNWDYSGLSVRAKYTNGTSKVLDSSEYTFSANKAKPRNYTTSLVVTATLNSDKSITGSKTFKNITVADEVYDEATEISKYYSDCKLSGTGNTLMNELHRHSFVKHTYFVKYGETTSYLSKAKDAEAPDLVPGEHKTIHFYTGNKTDYYSGTREHVWACNDSSGLWTHGIVDASDYIGGGSDLYHVRPCDSKVNTARGDAPYIDFDDSEFSQYKSKLIEVGDAGPYKLKIYDIDSDGKYAEYVEPADEFKGDIARIVAYLYMHYKTNTNTPSDKKSLTGDLNLNDVIGYGDPKKPKDQTRAIEILKKWNKMDEPSDVEKHRNHVVQQIQGNRNPFVDYPELLNKMFE